MTWFALHSALMLSLAFVVGLGVGWLIWARQWTPVEAPEAAPVPAVEPATILPALPTELTDVHPREPVDRLDSYWQPQAVASAPVTVPDSGFSVDDGVTEALPVLTDSAVQALPLQAGSVDTLPVETMPIPIPITAEALPAPAPLAAADLETATPDVAQAESDPGDLAQATTGGTDSEEVDVNEADLSEGGTPETDPAAAEGSQPDSADGALATGTPGAALIDDLTRIDGVTEAMATALAAEGLGSFFAVANAPEDHLRRALRVNRIRSAPGIAFWSARAAELAEEAKALRAATPPQGLVTDAPTEPETAAEPETMAEPEAVVEADAVVEPDVVEPAAVEPAAVEPAVVEPDAEAVPDAGPEAEAEPEGVAPVESADVTAPIALPTTRTGPGSAFRTVAHPSGPSWTTVGPFAEDDLERIVGIGPAVAASLREAGVANYTQLAAVRDEELRSILTDAGLSLPPTLSTWSVQAALLLQGDADGAATLAGGLMVGREGA